MSLTKGSQYNSDDFIALKARVKAEMNRRSGVGSLVTYAGTNYDYTANPKTGEQILVEHFNKIITPMNKINSTGFTDKNVGDIAEAIDSVEVQLSAYEKTSMRTSVNDCATSCSGTCYGGCHTACSSYSSCSCGYNCSGECSGDACKTSCGTSCNKACSVTCGEGGGCGMSCWGDCSAQWSSGCKGGCLGCTGGCNYSYGGPN